MNHLLPLVVLSTSFRRYKVVEGNYFILAPRPIGVWPLAQRISFESDAFRLTDEPSVYKEDSDALVYHVLNELERAGYRGTHVDRESKKGMRKEVISIAQELELPVLWYHDNTTKTREHIAYRILGEDYTPYVESPSVSL